MRTKKEPPITAVNKVRKTRKSSVTKKKTSSSRRNSGARRKRTSRDIPRWMLYILAALMVMIFSGAFYYFFIRPYAYRWKSCPGCKQYGVCMPSGYEVHGIDVSHYQGDIDWAEVARQQSNSYPIHFVFVKATEGASLGDDTFQKNFSSARKYGFIRGAYHFFSTKTDPLKQADFFIQTVKLDSGDLPPVLDVEPIGRKNKQLLVRNVKIWLDRIESHYGVKPILYTSYKFKSKYMDDSLFNAYPYWIAHYYVDSVQYRGKWRFWQHTDVGSIPGIKEEVDLNIFNGTLQELCKMTIKKKIN